MNISRASSQALNQLTHHEVVAADLKNPVRYYTQKTVEPPTPTHDPVFPEGGGVKFMVQSNLVSRPAYFQTPEMRDSTAHKEAAIEVFTEVGAGLLGGGVAALGGRAVLSKVHVWAPKVQSALFRGLEQLGGRPLIVAGGLIREAGQIAKNGPLTGLETLALSAPFGWNKTNPLFEKTLGVLGELHAVNSAKLTAQQSKLSRTQGVLGALADINSWAETALSEIGRIQPGPPKDTFQTRELLFDGDSDKWQKWFDAEQKKYFKFITRRNEQVDRYLGAIQTLENIRPTGLSQDREVVANLSSLENSHERHKVDKVVAQIEGPVSQAAKRQTQAVAKSIELNNGLELAQRWLGKP